jgi:hypothetical protein
MELNSQPPGSGSVSGAPLKWLRLEGILVFILGILLYAHTGTGWWRFVVLLLVPDVVMAGYWLGARWGAIFYNLGHSYVAPVALVAFAIVDSRPAWLPYLLIWTAHIAVDRALGYGLKYSAGFKNTHLGWLGKNMGNISSVPDL